MEELIKLNPKLGPRTNIETYIEFKDNGQVIYYYKQNGVIKKTPPKYERGFASQWNTRTVSKYCKWIL